VAFAERLGLEALFGAFTAGAILKLSDRDEAMTHPNFHHKLEAIGYGVFVPIFFVTSGLRFDLQALFASASGLALIPLFFVGLVVARGLPAWLYRPLIGGRQALVAGLLQSTSLPFIVVASQIGVELGMLTPAAGAALVAAGLLSVLVCPAAALTLLRREGMRA
jgi:Kef-type K+ transport system membrane component KefB